MSEHNAEAVIVTCIDLRFQEAIDTWIEKHFKPGTFDRVALAGGVYDLDTILKQIGISKRLHHTKETILMNHEDCGAYGEEGTAEKHSHDLREASEKIKELYPEMKVTGYYLHLNGTPEMVIEK